MLFPWPKTYKTYRMIQWSIVVFGMVFMLFFLANAMSMSSEELLYNAGIRPAGEHTIIAYPGIGFFIFLISWLIMLWHVVRTRKNPEPIEVKVISRT